MPIYVQKSERIEQVELWRKLEPIYIAHKVE
jgi:hypothetical protein